MNKSRRNFIKGAAAGVALLATGCKIPESNPFKNTGQTKNNNFLPPQQGIEPRKGPVFMGVDPANDDHSAWLVYVDGVLQKPGVDYYGDMHDKGINFVSPVPANAIIGIRYQCVRS